MSDSANSYACTAGAQDFTATAHRNNGERWVTVEGTCSCNTAGFKLELELATPPVVAVPDELHLNLTEKAPDGLAAAVVTDTPVKGKFRISDEVERVLIRNRGFSVPVKEG
ncbi:hypothetical protein AB0D29_06530 [Streptomyces sp. NPDC048424]|uniref:hypothetical protein n=1 Tax=Streptomyces sp. NPDC048424 TaxID=3155265 RepID=UPI003417B23E